MPGDFNTSLVNVWFGSNYTVHGKQDGLAQNQDDRTIKRETKEEHLRHRRNSSRFGNHTGIRKIEIKNQKEGFMYISIKINTTNCTFY